MIPCEVFRIGDHGGSSKSSGGIVDQLDRRKSCAISKPIHILPSKICKKLELLDHVIVLGQFDGRRLIICVIEKIRDCEVELKSVDSAIEKREKQRADISLFVALIP
jgi:hypothetical protein